MNRAYRLVWNQHQQAWVPAPEYARGRGKSGGLRTLAAAIALISGSAFALPGGGAVSSGQGSISQSGNTLTVSQQSQKLSLNWNSFNIAGNETVNFNQPNSSAIALNHILGSDPSQIYGHLNANGQVFLVNPNGLLFGQGAQVNVGGLVASTLNISDQDFKAGNFHFSGTAGSITNQGSINAAAGGYVALLGGQVSNQGSIVATLGNVSEAAGSDMTLDFAGDGLLSVQVNAGTLKALAENRELIQADGGHVLLTAKAANSLASAVVNNTGVVEAQTISNTSGVIELLGDAESGTVNVGGTLDASAPNGGNGGSIETSAATVTPGQATITAAAKSGSAGSWLIDPTDLTIDSTAASTINSTLGSGTSVSEQTTATSSSGSGTVTSGSGNINVNAALSWSTAATLSLSAYSSININAPVTITGAGSLSLTANNMIGGSNTAGSLNIASSGNIQFTGATPGALSINGSAYTLIQNIAQLPAITNNGNYALASNLNASALSSFSTIGSSSSPFTGSFNGLGNSIANLTITAPTQTYVGLFGYNTGSISNLTLSKETISGAGSVGGLVGWNLGALTNDHTGGSVSAAAGGTFTGGLAGYNFGTISNDSSSAVVSGSSFSGGLLGAMSAGSVTNSYASGSSTGSNYTGGLIGQLNAGSVSSSYATGAVHGGLDSGGLIGQVALGAISNTYASGAVTGTSNSGGLVGQIAAGSISTSYAAGAVSGGAGTGGLVASASGGSISASYWDTASTSQSSSAGGTGLSAAQMLQSSSFTGFGFTGSSPAWRIYNGDTMPLLESFLTPLTISANNVSKVYDASSAGLSGASYSLASAAGSADLFGVATPYGAVAKNNVGSYSANIWSDQQGYDITLQGGGLTVTPRTLTDTLVASNKVYDGTTSATFTQSLAGVLSGDAVTGTVKAAFADANAGSNKVVTASSLTLAGTDAANYIVPVLPTGTATITPATITASLTGSVSKTYDATSTATLGASNFSFTGLIGGDSISLIEPAIGSFASSNAGSGLAVSASGLGLSGAAVGNYVLASTSVTANIGSITPKTIDVSSFTANNKVYDGSLAASGSWGSLSGIIGTDNVTITGASFSDKNVGNSKKVSLVLGGSAGQDYAVAETASATITPAQLALSGLSAASKVYDGTTAATASGTLGGLISGDHVGLAASFSNKNVGIAKQVTVNGLNGADAGNYSFVAGATTSATISAASLTASLVGTVNKVYDGTTTATLGASNYALAGVFGSDAVSTNTPVTGSYAAHNTGTGIATTVTGLSLTGADAGNYVLANTVASAHIGNITAKALSLNGITALNKTYDGTTAAQLAGVLTGAVAGDSLGLVAKFSDKNAGTGKTVTTTLTGSAATNYTLAADTLLANINQAPLTLSNLKAQNKVYDGSTKVSASGKLGGVIGTDLVNWSAVFTSANAGVETVNASLTGAGAGNYYLSSGQTTTATIAPKRLMLTIDPQNKVYDGTNTAQVHVVIAGIVLGDQVSASVASTFANSNAGSDKAVIINGVTLLGASASNYVAVTGGHPVATILPATLIITVDDITEAYTGTAFSGGNGVSYSGFAGTDTASVLGGTLSYTGAAQHAVKAGTYLLSATGLTDSNYRVSYVAGHLVITP